MLGPGVRRGARGVLVDEVGVLEVDWSGRCLRDVALDEERGEEEPEEEDEEDDAEDQCDYCELLILMLCAGTKRQRITDRHVHTAVPVVAHRAPSQVPWCGWGHEEVVLKV